MNPGPGWANGITITVSAPLTRLPRTYLQLHVNGQVAVALAQLS